VRGILRSKEQADLAGHVLTLSAASFLVHRYPRDENKLKRQFQADEPGGNPSKQPPGSNSLHGWENGAFEFGQSQRVIHQDLGAGPEHDCANRA
jgi:hypothetical protein